MVSIKYNKMGLSVNAVWFCDQIDEAVNMSKADLVYLHGVEYREIDHSISNLQYTLITDLKKDLNDVFKGFGNSCRKQLNKAEKEDIEFVVFDASDLKKDPKILKSFQTEYAEFTKLKGIPNTFNKAALIKYIDSGNVILSKAYKGNINYAQHIDILDGKSARGLYSVSNFRSEGIDSNIAGLANRYLEWFVLKYLHSKNYESYDWGGLNSIDNRNGVDQFKLSFGGQEKQYYNIVAGKSVLGKLAISFAKLNRKRRKNL